MRSDQETAIEGVGAGFVKSISKEAKLSLTLLTGIPVINYILNFYIVY